MVPSSRSFPPPWTIEEPNDACFVMKTRVAQKLGYFYFEDEPAGVADKRPQHFGVIFG
jgi:hypothetical protein